MQIERFDIAGLTLITPRVFEDARGAFMETYSRRAYQDAIGDVDFVQDNQSYSAKRGTLRGLHLQTPPMAQAKLVRVLSGAVLDVAVDLRTESPTYLRHVAVELSAAGGQQLFVPQGFAHGFLTLHDHVEIAYKVDNYYSGAHDRSVQWADPALKIDWGMLKSEIVLSDKDKNAPRVGDIEAPFEGWS